MDLGVDERPSRKFHGGSVGIPTRRARLEPVQKEEPEGEADVTGILCHAVRQMEGRPFVLEVGRSNSFSAEEDLGDPNRHVSGPEGSVDVESPVGCTP